VCRPGHEASPASWLCEKSAAVFGPANPTVAMSYPWCVLSWPCHSLSQPNSYLLNAALQALLIADSVLQKQHQEDACLLRGADGRENVQQITVTIAALPESAAGMRGQAGNSTAPMPSIVHMARKAFGTGHAER
jgi:hypothetical protein